MLKSVKKLYLYSTQSRLYIYSNLDITNLDIVNFANLFSISRIECILQILSINKGLCYVSSIPPSMMRNLQQNSWNYRLGCAKSWQSLLIVAKWENELASYYILVHTSKFHTSCFTKCSRTHDIANSVFLNPNIILCM